MKKCFTPVPTDLIAQCMASDRKSQKDLYDHLSPTMFRLYLKSHPEQEAEHLLQQSFIKLFNNLHTCPDPAAFDNWVMKMFEEIV